MTFTFKETRATCAIYRSFCRGFPVSSNIKTGRAERQRKGGFANLRNGVHLLSVQLSLSLSPSGLISVFISLFGRRDASSIDRSGRGFSRGTIKAISRLIKHGRSVEEKRARAGRRTCKRADEKFYRARSV